MNMEYVSERYDPHLKNVHFLTQIFKSQIWRQVKRFSGVNLILLKYILLLISKAVRKKTLPIEYLTKWKRFRKFRKLFF